MVSFVFVGFTLKGENAEHQWTGHKQSDEDAGHMSSKLIVKRLVLGAEASSEELNVIEAETMSFADMVKLPIAVLKVGEDRQVNMGDLEFHDAPVTFRLTKGKGPVHVLATHLQQEGEESMVAMEEFTESEEELDDEIKADNGENPKKKIKLSKDQKKNKNEKGK